MQSKVEIMLVKKMGFSLQAEPPTLTAPFNLVGVSSLKEKYGHGGKYQEAWVVRVD